MRARFLAITPALLLVAACATPLPEPTSVPPTTTPGEDAASLEADRLFATLLTCEVTLGGRLVKITFPAAWSTNAAIEDEELPACVWFGPDVVVHRLLTEGPKAAAITVGAVGGPAVFNREWMSREETTIADRPAWRVEESVPSPNNAANETLQLVYWISLGTTSTDGPTLVARTATEDAGDYALNKAVLDRMMASLELR